jgi:hypothetical protein
VNGETRTRTDPVARSGRALGYWENTAEHVRLLRVRCTPEACAQGGLSPMGMSTDLPPSGYSFGIPPPKSLSPRRSAAYMDALVPRQLRVDRGPVLADLTLEVANAEVVRAWASRQARAGLSRARFSLRAGRRPAELVSRAAEATHPVPVLKGAVPECGAQTVVQARAETLRRGLPQGQAETGHRGKCPEPGSVFRPIGANAAGVHDVLLLATRSRVACARRLR